MSVLLLTDEARAIAAEVVAYAEAHRFSVARIRELMAANVAIGEDPLLTCVIPVDYRCAFSIEEQPFGWARHISVSVPYRGKFPAPAALSEILPLFGFHGGFDAIDAYYIEGGRAINLLQRYDPT